MSVTRPDMDSRYDNDLLRQGILHFKSGEYEMARRFLERALIAADDIETHLKANFYLSQIESDPASKRKYLEEVLAADPFHPEARRALAILEGKLKSEEIINPENLPAVPNGTISSQADRFTCPTCGGRMAFAPDGQTLTCDFCSSRQNISPEQVGEQDFLLTMATAKGHLRSEAMHAFHCKGCGAEFLLAPEAISATCAWCGSNHVVNLDERHELIPPQAILPFAFDGQQANRFLLVWLKQTSLRLERRPEPLRGLYVPIWTFDMVAQIPWNCRVENQLGSYESVRGEAVEYFDNVPICASRRVPPGFNDLLKSCSLSGMTSYDPRYLANWPAQTYEISMSDASLEARAWAVQQERKKARLSNVDLPDNATNFRTGAPKISVASFKLALVSVWLTGYELDGRSYTVLLDSQTGRVHAGQPERNGLLGWLDKALDL